MDMRVFKISFPLLFSMINGRSLHSFPVGRFSIHRRMEHYKTVKRIYALCQYWHKEITLRAFKMAWWIFVSSTIMLCNEGKIMKTDIIVSLVHWMWWERRCVCVVDWEVVSVVTNWQVQFSQFYLSLGKKREAILIKPRVSWYCMGVVKVVAIYEISLMYKVKASSLSLQFPWTNDWILMNPHNTGFRCNFHCRGSAVMKQRKREHHVLFVSRKVIFSFV